MQFLYNLLVIPLLYGAFRLVALFNSKVRTGIRGRKHIFNRLKIDFRANVRPIIWFHISSYGEFEQAKPVLFRLKEKNSAFFIMVTFFSPSAYEHIPLSFPVDYICYLPFDSLRSAKRFISIVNPQLAVIVRHDIWPNFLWTLKKKNIPAILIDASIPPKSSRFLPIIRTFNKKLFNNFTAILTISNEETDRISTFVSDSKKIIMTGDTKFDQVYQRSLETEKIAPILNHPFLKKKRVWVIGSSWASDEKYIFPAYSNLLTKFHDLILLLVPHETSDDRIEDIQKKVRENGMTSIRYTELKDSSDNFNVLIVDRIGLLANLYRLGNVAFVGGSMEQKVHNVLEPAAHGIPVLFGPCITTQAEVLKLVQRGGGFIMNTAQEIEEKISLFLNNKEEALKAGNNARDFIVEHKGASEKTVQILMKYIKT